MPQWLSNQLLKAFQKKDRRQIKLLNDCWFFYSRRTITNSRNESTKM